MPRISPEPVYRAQVAALPVRLGVDGWQVMLISSRETQRWIVPKGWPMKGRKDHEAARREALEEAGVSGRIRKHPLGAYTYDKRLIEGTQPCRVMVYLLEVDKELPSWREKGQRQRQWFSLESAADLISEPGLARLMRSLDARPDAAKPRDKRVPSHGS